MFKIDSVAVRDLLLRRCLSIQELAARAGLSMMTARKFLSGDEHTANATTVSKLARALDVDATAILRPLKV